MEYSDVRPKPAFTDNERVHVAEIAVRGLEEEESQPFQPTAT